jgi:dTDP-4-dehydrorhamnose reductase
MRKNDKVLILGSLGNLGNQIVRIFGNEYRLVCWDREDVDVLDYELLEEKIEEIKPNIIINTVAYNAVDKCEEDDVEFKKAQKLNGDVAGVLADITLRLDAILVHYVSDYVFDGKKQEGYIENDATCAISKYGETKIMGETEILKRKDLGLKYYLVRTSKLFGPKGSSEESKPSFFDIMLKIGKEKERLDVVDEEMSCFTYTTDLAIATKELVEAKKKYGIYHLVNEGACTWYEAVLVLFKLANIKTKVSPVNSDKFPRPAKRPKFSVLKNTKIHKMRDYKEALREYLDICGN